MVTTAKIVGALRRAKLAFSKSERSRVHGCPHIFSGFKVRTEQGAGVICVHWVQGNGYRPADVQAEEARQIKRAARALAVAGIVYKATACTIEVPLAQ